MARYLNVKGMLPFEDIVADYIKETNNHVLYRVSSIFEGDNLIAAGVQMEAEDIVDGSQISKSVLDELASENVTETLASEQQPIVNERTYILNTNTKKFHNPTCRDIGKMKDENKQEYAGSREDIMNQEYAPCKHCNP